MNNAKAALDWAIVLVQKIDLLYPTGEPVTPEHVITLSIEAIKKIKSRYCGCNHPIHPGFVCGWPISSVEEMPGMFHCGCEG